MNGATRWPFDYQSWLPFWRLRGHSWPPLVSNPQGESQSEDTIYWIPEVLQETAAETF